MLQNENELSSILLEVFCRERVYLEQSDDWCLFNLYIEWCVINSTYYTWPQSEVKHSWIILGEAWILSVWYMTDIATWIFGYIKCIHTFPALIKVLWLNVLHQTLQCLSEFLKSQNSTGFWKFYSQCPCLACKSCSAHNFECKIAVNFCLGVSNITTPSPEKANWAIKNMLLDIPKALHVLCKVSIQKETVACLTFQPEVFPFHAVP